MLVVFGGVLVLIGLMGRVPLLVEVGGAKLDASYDRDVDFQAGFDSGLERGLETAVEEVKESISAEDASLALERVSELLAALRNLQSHQSLEQSDEGSVTRGDAGRMLFRGPEACRAAGITYRQLDYWARTGLVTPSGAASDARLYTTRDIVTLAVAKRLLDTGVSMLQVRLAARALAALSDPQFDREQLFLVSDGTDVTVGTDLSGIAPELGQGRGVFALNVAVIKRDVTRKLQALGDLSEPEGA